MTGVEAQSQSSADSLDLVGIAYVVDGDTLEIAGRRLRLLGIDAPEGRQTCTDAKQRSYDCGQASTQALKKMVDRGETQCTGIKLDRYRRLLVNCWINGVFVNRELVRQGWAVGYGPGDFVAEEAEASSKRVGIWAGSFVRPKDYRRSSR